MAKFQAKDIRNVVLCGHGGTGKTTLTDKLLNFTGAAPNHGSVDQGTSFCDFDEEEKTHKYTIESAVTNFVYKDHLFNFIDTPGYADFIGQTIGAMAGVENAIITINAQAGIQVNTRRVFKEAEAEHPAHTDCHVAVGGKVEINLQCEGNCINPGENNGGLCTFTVCGTEGA